MSLAKAKNKKAAELMQRARAGLIIDQPFFASLLLPMPMIEDDSIQTMATDGDRILYNPDWVSTLTLQENTFVQAHEVLHCVFDHMGRRENRNHNKWNQAADYVINDILVKERVGTMPKVGLLDPALVQKGEGTAEGVYRLLPQEAENNECGKPGGSLDSVFDAGSDMGSKPVDAATKAEKSADMKVRVIQAKNAAKMQGRLSKGMERLVEELIKPRVDWREVLRRFVSQRAKVEHSFARPKRRFLGMDDLYLPSLTGEKMGILAVAVDCSGSIDDRLLTKFASEINAIRQDVHPSRIDVVYFDSEVCGLESFESEQDVVLKPHGGGGTAFSPVFEHLNAQAELPVACVFLTDLYCSDFGDAPQYPVLWCVLEGDQSGNVPFGEVVEVSDEDDKA